MLTVLLDFQILLIKHCFLINITDNTILIFVRYKFAFLGGTRVLSLLSPTSSNTHGWSRVVIGTRRDFPLVTKWMSSQSDWNTEACSAEWVLTSARQICVADIHVGNFGEHSLCWTRLRSTIAHKQFDQKRVQQSGCSRALANFPTIQILARAREHSFCRTRLGQDSI